MKTQKSIIITGPPASGKTTKALELVKDKLYQIFDSAWMKGSFPFEGLKKETTHVIVEGATPEVIKSLATEKTLMVERQGKPSYYREPPQFIFILCNSFRLPADRAPILRHFEIIEL